MRLNTSRVFIRDTLNIRIRNRLFFERKRSTDHFGLCSDKQPSFLVLYICIVRRKSQNRSNPKILYTYPQAEANRLGFLPWSVFNERQQLDLMSARKSRTAFGRHLSIGAVESTV